MKRKHQIDFETAIDDLAEGRRFFTRIIPHVTPGGGKSYLPIITAKLISAGILDRLLWVCPRQALQIQGERNFIDPFARSMFCHNLTVRQSTNEIDPCRGNDGFITTYQAIAADENKTVLNEVKSRNYGIILDEFHHVEKDGEWHEALKPIMDQCSLHVLMTGTLQRGNDAQIAFIDYENTRYGFRPIVEDNDRQAVITYGRSQALQDKAILPIHFVFSDGRAAWETKNGAQINVGSFYDALPKERGAALHAALSTEFADQLLNLTLEHFIKYRETVPSARLLVVTANIDQARTHYENLYNAGYDVGIATSHDNAEAVENIEKFKTGELNVLVTIAMAYEGLDVPEVSHIACLTHIRTKPWIEQMFARAVRINRSAGAWEDQVAYVFVPDDVIMREIVSEIDREQIGVAKDGRAHTKILKPGAGIKRGIMPLNSAVTKKREETLDSLPKTPKQEEETYLRLIEGHIRRFAFANRMEAREINTEIVREFGKGRRQMRLSELKKLFHHVGKTYPLGRIVRGTGKKRVPTKPQFVQAELFDTGFMKGFEY